MIYEQTYGNDLLYFDLRAKWNPKHFESIKWNQCEDVESCFIWFWWDCWDAYVFPKIHAIKTCALDCCFGLGFLMHLNFELFGDVLKGRKRVKKRLIDVCLRASKGMVWGNLLVCEIPYFSAFNFIDLWYLIR